jgi:predicted RNase H-like HicB family nuclease
MVLRVEFDIEDDGHWIADIPELPGVNVFGASNEEALAKVQRLALDVLAVEMEKRQEPKEFLTVSFVAA